MFAISRSRRQPSPQKYDPFNPLHSEFISLVSAQLQHAYLRTHADDLNPNSDAVHNKVLDEVTVSDSTKSEAELADAILSQLVGSTSVVESLRAVNFQPQPFEKVFYFIYYLLLKRPLLQILIHLGLNFFNPT